MSESQDLGPIDAFEQEVEGVIEELEETKSELEELNEWLEEAPSEWGRMSEDNQSAFRRRAGELQTQLRNATSPESLVEHGTAIREAFSEPVQQTAVARFHDVVDLLDLDLSDDRINEYEDRIRQRPGSALQTDAQGYGAVVEILEDELSFVHARIAQEVESDPATYLIGPATDLTPFVTRIRERRETLAEIENALAEAGSWVPSDLTTLVDDEALYQSIDESLDIEAIREEISAVDEHIEDSQYDITAVVESEAQSKLGDCPPDEFRSELNDIAANLATFTNRYHNPLQEVETLITNDRAPESLSEAMNELEAEYRKFENRSPANVVGLNSIAAGVESEFEELVEVTSDELQTLDSMCGKIRISFDVSDVHSTPTAEELGDLSPSSVSGNLDAAFEAINAYRGWIDEAFDVIATQFEADDVRELFELLYTEDEVPLSQVNTEALDALGDDLPIVVSLRR